MNSNSIKNKLKKYLFFISIVFFSITFFHLIYIYIYDGSILKPQKGGTISESFVGKLPSLNPLKYYPDNYNSYINHILYRSLSSYNAQKKQIIGDLANCNIENTQNIKCYLTQNIKWSNGDDITTQDIKYTYEIIKKYNTNPVIKNILENVKVETTRNSITFKSDLKDVNILNLLFQPILKKDFLEKIPVEKLTGNFSFLNSIYSGKYIISKVDSSSGNLKIFLDKNPYYIKNPAYIDHIILKFYKDYTELLKQKNNIDIFFDKKHLIGNSIPKLKENKYILPQYVGIFLNKDKLIYPNLRNFILTSINKKKIINSIGNKYNKQIDSPFLDDNLKLNIPKNDISLKTMLNSLGYYKKSYFLSKLPLIKEKPYLYSQEFKIKNKLKSDSGKIDITKIKNSISKDNYNSDSKIIFSPVRVDKYNFITKPEITLKGKVPKNTKEIYINDYKLKSYSPGDKEFFYKLSPKIGNIKLGKNTYKIYFVDNSGNKKLAEEVVFFYRKDKKTLEKDETNLISFLINQKITQERQKLNSKKSQNKQTQYSNKQLTDLNQKIEKIKKLDDNFYYNKNLKVFSLNLYYIKGSEDITKAALEIKDELEKSGIKINITEIKSIDLIKQIKNNKEEYDILLAGINLGYFPFDLSRYFYSGQIDKGQNFTKIKDSELDNILEELKSYPLIDKKIKEKQQKAILKIFEKQNIFLPLYSPIYSNLVLKNIEGYKLSSILPKHIYRFDPLINSYILKQKIINKKDKSIIGFFAYLIDKLF